MNASVSMECDHLVRWLRDAALPFWAGRGQASGGGFHEVIAQTGEPLSEPRRCFTTARQLYVYSVANEFGFDGADVARHALDDLLKTFRLADGLFARAVDPISGVPEVRFDLYDHAFVLLGLARAGEALAFEDALSLAHEVIGRLIERYRHSSAGFEEAWPRHLPLRANPHMHLFEAALEWMETSRASGESDQIWGQMADEIAELSLSRFINPETGALHEFFDGDWNRAPGDDGRLVEPGHQFEWAWLLTRWGVLRKREDAMLAARRLAILGETHGIREGLAVDELWQDLSVRRADALLWPQTERIKAWAILAKIAKTPGMREEALERTAAACAGLRRYFATPIAGLWFKQRFADGAFDDGPAPARYLYHIVCAARELKALV